jgi:hypothetical protein
MNGMYQHPEGKMHSREAIFSGLDRLDADVVLWAACDEPRLAWMGYFIRREEDVCANRIVRYMVDLRDGVLYRKVEQFDGKSPFPVETWSVEQ